MSEFFSQNIAATLFVRIVVVNDYDKKPETSKWVAKRFHKFVR